MALELWHARKDPEEINLPELESAISKAVFENPESELGFQCVLAPAEGARPHLELSDHWHLRCVGLVEIIREMEMRAE